MTYSFRNRFVIDESERIAIDAHAQHLADSPEDGTVVLEAAGRDTEISQTHELVLCGSGYADEAAAIEAGRKWRRVLTAALARDRKAADFGPDDKTTPVTDLIVEKEPLDWLKPLGVVVGDRVIGDDIRLMVYESAPAPKFLSITMNAPIVMVGAERLLHDIADASSKEQDQPWSRQKWLAYQLVHSALRDRNAETRHIQLVTAIEIMIPGRQRPGPIVEALDNIMARVDEILPGDDDDAPTVGERLKQILREAKNESIVRAGREYIGGLLEGEYGTKSPANFFRDVYNMRSRLVHHERPGEHRPSTEDIIQVYGELLRLTLDLLDTRD
jgi:hypothetical protein